MYNIGGCFTGPTFKDLKMGEYHGVLTLDTGEAVRVVIPEAVQLPGKLSHSNLLANTPYLMAGHSSLVTYTNQNEISRGRTVHTNSQQRTQYLDDPTTLTH
jgi:hypothetical protein